MRRYQPSGPLCRRPADPRKAAANPNFRLGEREDGSFEMPKVPAGTYYVVAELKGYLSPLSALSTGERMSGGADAVKKIQAQAEKIVVQDAPVRVDVRLERGGSISGVIRYDDGNPAPDVKAIRMVMQEDGKWKVDTFSPLKPATTTDDRGHYRISGLPKGKYAVRADLPTDQSTTGLGSGSFDMHPNYGDALVVYSGGVFREKDIKPIEVGAGDDVDGVDLVFPVDNLHLVSGTVTARADNHRRDTGQAVRALTQTPSTGFLVLLSGPPGKYDGGAIFVHVKGNLKLTGWDWSSPQEQYPGTSLPGAQTFHFDEVGQRESFLFLIGISA